MSDFKIQVDRLDEKIQAFRFLASQSWWRSREEGSDSQATEIVNGFAFQLDVTRKVDAILISGHLEADVILECSRCARRYSHALRDPFRLALEPAKGREPTDLEGVQGLAVNGIWLGEELEAGWFRGPNIGLDDFFGEVIAMAMPLQPVCSESCPGICSHCGVDLAKTQCDCVDERIESPFAVLAKLKGVTEKK